MSKDRASPDAGIRLVLGGVTAVCGVAQATVNGLAWLNASGAVSEGSGAWVLGGVCVTAIGILIMYGRAAGRPLVLAPELWRYWVVGAVLLFAALQTVWRFGEPAIEWFRPIPMFSAALGLPLLFGPAPDRPLRLGQVTRRRWRGSITALLLAGALALLLAVALWALGQPRWAAHPLPFAGAYLVLAGLLHRRLRTWADLSAPSGDR